MKHPHVLILMTDQQRGDAMSCAGHPVVRTPHMDRLAAEGVRFANAYTTSPVCMPARCNCLSGLYCHNTGQWSNYGYLPPDVDTYARRLQEAGYRTCYIGKSHFCQPRRGEDIRRYDWYMNALGWEDVMDTGGHWATVELKSIYTEHLESLGLHERLVADYEKRRHRVNGHIHGVWPSVLPEGEAISDFLAATGVEYVLNYQHDAPMLLFMGFDDPHEPWDPPASWAEQYLPEQMPPAESPTEPGEWVPEKAAARQREWHSQLDVTEEQVRLIQSRYFAKIAHVDACMGRVLEAFEERGWLEDAVVILWSDHGEMLCDKRRIHKGVYYEPSVNVPLVIRRPGEKNAGAAAWGLAEITDLFPTILELAGCSPKEGAFGRSLVPMCDDPGATVRDAVFGEIDAAGGRATMIRDERHKMAIDEEGDGLMLYDLVEDPIERINLLGKPGMEDVEARLRDRLLRWHADTVLDQRIARASFTHPGPPVRGD